MMPPARAGGLLAFVVAVLACGAASLQCSRGSGRSSPDTAADVRRDDVARDAGAPGSPAADACASPPGEVGQACGCGDTCAGGARCAITCAGTARRGICVGAPADVGACGCGVVLDDRCTGGARCLCPRSCDGEGLCLTTAQNNALCAGPYRDDFLCL